MGVGSRTFFSSFVGLGADIFSSLFFSACVGSCGNSTEKSWRCLNGRGRTIMWRFVNQNIYLSEGGEFVSSIFPRFPLSSFISSFQFRHPAIFSPAFTSPSPHALSFSHSLIKRVTRDGHYGLYLDENLTDGSSAACPTFGNPPLCSLGPRKAAGSVDFECVGLEVWGCGP
jgi:hypothetical protein